MLDWIIMTSGFLVATGAGIYAIYQKHLQDLAKMKAKHEKEKHYLRRDQRARLRETKAKTREHKAQLQALADKKAHDTEMKNLTNALQAVNRIGSGEHD